MGAGVLQVGGVWCLGKVVGIHKIRDRVRSVVSDTDMQLTMTLLFL